MGDFAAVLERLGVRYAVSGSVASSYFGEPRSTHDVDVLIEIDAERVAALVKALEEHFHVTEEAVRDSLDRRMNFNALHARTYTRFDVYIAREGELDRAQLERRSLQPLYEGSQERVQITAPEVLVLRKLDWFRKTQLTSERQWLDVLGILKRQTHRLDLAYMRALADKTGLNYLLRRALDEAGLAP